MTYKELEERLPILRKEMGVTYKWLQEHGLSNETVHKINHGENYKIGSLFKYVDNLYYTIKVDGVIVKDLQALGQFLKNKRKELGFNGIEMQSKLVWSASQLAKIEKGQEYFKSSFLAYIEVVPVDFDLISLLNISNDDEQEYFNIE